MTPAVKLATELACVARGFVGATDRYRDDWAAIPTERRWWLDELRRLRLAAGRLEQRLKDMEHQR